MRHSQILIVAALIASGRTAAAQIISGTASSGPRTGSATVVTKGPVIDGKLENLAMPNRFISGTWKSQRGSGAFRIQRQ